MRRRLTLVTAPLAFALALLMPATSLASGGIFFAIFKDYCTDYPANVLKIKFYTDGSTNANKLTIDSKGQTRVNGHWTTYKVWSQASTTLAAHSAGEMFLQRTYKGDAFNRNHIVFTMQAWHNSTLIYSEKFKSVPC